MDLLDSRSRTALLATAVLAAGWLPPAQAQRAAVPFGHVEAYAAGAANVNENLFHRFWKPGYGAEGALSSPFYFGFVELGGGYQRFEANRAEVPGYTAVQVFAGWGARVRVAGPLSWQNGFRIGNTRMTFEEDALPGIQNESEMTGALYSRLRLGVFRGLALHVAGSYQRTFTREPVELVYVSGGVSGRARTPRWLQTFLR